MQDTSQTPHVIPLAGDTHSAPEPAFQFIDSTVVAQKADTVKPIAYIDFYGGHELKPRHTNEIPYMDATPDWLFYVILLVIAALAWIRYFFGKIFGQTLQAVFNMNITNQIVRDENVLLQRTSSFLGIIFNVVFALLLYHVSNRLHWNLFNIDNSFGRFLFLMLTVSAVYSFKFLLLKILGFVFGVEREMATYIFNIFLINNMLGLVLIPIAVLLSFPIPVPATTMLIIGGVLYGLALNYRVLRGVMIALSYKGVNLWHLFLYFCALEFAPVVVLIKILTG